jgi:hypothetical protein
LLETIWHVLIGAAIFVFFVYSKWKQITGNYKGLGNGGIQTLFRNRRYDH